MFRRKCFLFIFLSITVINNLYSKVLSFEGSIKFVKETVYDTSQIVMYVKGDLVRVDAYNSKNVLTNSYLINLSNEKMLAISPQRKLYKEVPLALNVSKANPKSTVLKTENCMVLNGEVCHQWRVTDISRNSVVTYWVCDHQFDFFESFLKIIYRSGVGLKLFPDIPDLGGKFPMLTVERTRFRKQKMQVAISNINMRHLSDNLFSIPPGYRKIES